MCRRRIIFSTLTAAAPGRSLIEYMKFAASHIESGPWTTVDTPLIRDNPGHSQSPSLAQDVRTFLRRVTSKTQGPNLTS